MSNVREFPTNQGTNQVDLEGDVKMEITLRGNEVDLRVPEGNVNLVTMAQIMWTVLLGAANEVYDAACARLETEADPDSLEDEKRVIKGQLFDIMNVSASNALYIFAPEIELHPDLTAEAMLAAENRFLEEQVSDEE